MRHTRLKLEYYERRTDGAAIVEFTPFATNKAAQDLAEWLNKSGSMTVVRRSKSLPRPFTLEEFFERARRGPNCVPSKFLISGVWMDLTGNGDTFSQFSPTEPIGRLGMMLSMMKSLKEITKVRRCARCKKWFAGKKRDRLYCSDTCRQIKFLQTPHWREYNRLYQKRYRTKQRVEKCQQRATNGDPKARGEFAKAKTEFRKASAELDRFRARR